MYHNYRIKGTYGKQYPHKSKIAKTVENADIEPFVHGVQKYLTEEMLYDFMLEAKTENCKSFKKWVTNEVLPTIISISAYKINISLFKNLSTKIHT